MAALVFCLVIFSVMVLEYPIIGNWENVSGETG